MRALRSFLQTSLALAVLLGVGGPAQAQPPGPGGPPSWERFTERHDLDGDGQVSADEFGRSDARFQELDADGDGFVVREDFERAVAAGRQRMGAGFLRSADGDRDGAVTAGEWADFLAEIDADGDGLVSEAELPAPPFRPGRPGPPPPPEDAPEAGVERPSRVEHLATVLDEDGDGVLEIADLQAAFASADADGDGALTGDELPSRPDFRGHGPRGRRSGGGPAGQGGRP